MVEEKTKNLVHFLEKTYELVNDPNTNDLISWDYNNHTFIIWDHLKFSSLLLQQHFRHDNFSSFVRQLNDYGFRKANIEPCEYYHKFFQPGRKDLLFNIKRRSLMKKEKHNANEREHALYRFHLIESEYEKLQDIHQKLKNEINEVRRECEKLKKQLANARSKEEMVNLVMKALSDPLILQQIKNIARKKIEESDVQVTKKPRLSEEIDKTQDSLKPNNRHAADNRSKEEPQTKALSIDLHDINCGDYFAMEKIGEFLLDDTAIFQNASQGDLEGEWNTMCLMELITDLPLSVELKSGIEDKEDDLQKMVRFDDSSSNNC